MKKLYSFLGIIICLLTSNNIHAASWEKLYCNASTDCFRNVHEVSGGGFIAAGYTANLTAHDTDALVLRLDAGGDTLWSIVYNGTGSKEDCFYKVKETNDNGFILCGYSKSFGSGEQALYMKISSGGNIQWTKTYGGSGIERAQDIIQLPDNKFVVVGYTTSSPAQYYDAYIQKLDQSGNIEWTKSYGTSAYDDANSVRVLSDGGFITGGQSNNQLYMIRTDANGNLDWSKTLGTSGIDNIECINFAQGGNGFILSGSTDGAGAGGDDGYIVLTDTGGVQIWAKTFGGNLNDDFHRIEPTSDGGYIASGTSSQSAWANPNIWLLKLDAAGSKQWEKFYGGDNHDHGYGGEQTSDGGYIVGGHTHSFGDNAEDGILFRTNSAGDVTNKLNYVTITDLITPSGSSCGSASAQVQVEITNYGEATLTSVPVTVEITGAITQTFTQTYTGSIARNAVKTFTFNSTIDMSGGGNFYFHCYTTGAHDVIPAHNYYNKTISASVTSASPSVTGGTRCGSGVVTLNATSPDPLKWYAGSSGGSSLFTGAAFNTPYISSTTTYYVQAGTSCPSARVPVVATVTAGLTAPVTADVSRCGNGTVTLSATSSTNTKWFSSSTSSTVLATAATFTTPSLSSTTTYYVCSDNGSCTSSRVAVDAVINDPADDPVTTGATRCSNGTLQLHATASDPVKWYGASSGGTSLFTGLTFTTPSISSTTTYYAQADDGVCPSTRIATVASISPAPNVPVAADVERCGTGTLVLNATSNDDVEWYDAASGGTLVGNGNMFITPSISANTTYYALANNGGCSSALVACEAIVNAVPSDAVTTSSSSCGDGTVTLIAAASDNVDWFTTPSGTTPAASGATFVTPSLTTTTTYYAITNNGNCSGNAVAATATIYSLPLVDIGTDTILASGISFPLDAGAGFSGYSWSTSESSQTITATSSGTYCVTVTDVNSCTASDCSFIDFSTGVKELASSSISLFPNPAHEKLVITSTPFYSNAKLSLMDITGKIILEKKISSLNSAIDLSGIHAGIYIVKINSFDGEVTKRLIIE